MIWNSNKEKSIKKSALVAIVGRPSVGKSSLMNALCGEKISIVTPVPQTTRNRIRGILNDERGQIVFLDTPGLHQSERIFNRRLRNLVRGSIDDCDFVLYVTDVTRGVGSEEEELVNILAACTLPILIVWNKVDLGSAREMREDICRLFSARRGGGELPPDISQGQEVSALKGDGLDELKTRLFSLSPVGEALYPADCYTDQEPAFRIAEIIREQAMLRSREELPHAIRVDIQDLEAQEDSRLWIRASICVESKSQIGLVVGRNGSGIRDIRKASQREIGRVFPYRVHLDLRVKCSPNWRRNEARKA